MFANDKFKKILYPEYKNNSHPSPANCLQKDKINLIKHPSKDDIEITDTCKEI